MVILTISRGDTKYHEQFSAKEKSSWRRWRMQPSSTSPIYLRMVMIDLFGSHAPYLPQATTIEGSLFQQKKFFFSFATCHAHID